MVETELTQEQIDAMLDDNDATAASGGAVNGADTAVLTDFERETMGNMPSVLNAMTGIEFNLDSVEFVPVTSEDLPMLLADDLVFSLPIDIGEPLIHALIVDIAFAKSVAASLTGGDTDSDVQLTEMELSAIQETISQINGTYLTGLATVLQVTAAGESVAKVDATDIGAAVGEGAYLGTLTITHDDKTMQVRHLIPAMLVELIMDHIKSAPAPAPEPSTAIPETPATTPATPAAAAAQPSSVAAATPIASGSIVAPTTEYASASFSQLEPLAVDVDTRNLDMLLDVPLHVTVELGKTQLPIRQILEYSQGSLITLDKLAGEPIDLLVNGKHFAKGEVVVIDENFGVRITSILSQSERIAQLS